MNKYVPALCFLLLMPVPVFAAMLTGHETVYRVVEGDSLLLIGAKLGVDVKTIARENDLDPDEDLQPGQELRVNNRKIAPKTAENGIIIDIPGRMLYYFKAGKLELFFPVGLGMPQWEDITRWRTPAGPFTIRGKEQNPVWYVPESIRWQLLMQGKPVIISMPPGPNNPLGRFVLYTSKRGIAIHETIWPTTVYQFRSHGCVRVLPQNIEQFYNQVDVGTQGELVYEPVKVAVTEEGRIFLQVDPDAYRKVKKLQHEAINRINDMHVGAEVNWDKVKKLAREKTGNAEDVTLFPAPSPCPRIRP